MALAPTDDLFRGAFPGVELRDDEADAATLFGHFALFDTWTEIDSIFEGRFLERIAKGAFKRTFNAQRGQIRVTFDHGFDPQLGDKPLGPPDVMREVDEGAYYEVPLLDTDYNRDFILPTLQGRLMDGTQRGSNGLLGASFRFRVIADEWNDEPGVSKDNPQGIPERTVREVRLYEFGPVVYPAYEGATAKVRSLTDHYRKKDLARRGTAARAAEFLASDLASPGNATDAETPDSPASSHLTEHNGSDPAAVLALARSLRRA